MKDFMEVLRPIKELIVFKTYPAREKYDEMGSAQALAQALGCPYAENVYAIKKSLKQTVREGDIVLFLGAGDIYYTAQFLLRELI